MIIFVLLNSLLVAWLYFGFATPFLSNGIFQGNMTWVVDTYKLMMQLTVAVFLFGMFNFRLVRFQQARDTKKYLRYIVLRPLVWALICVATYGALIGKHATIVAEPMRYVMELRGYSAISKREMSMPTASPYSLYGLTPFRFYRYVYRYDGDTKGNTAK